MFDLKTINSLARVFPDLPFDENTIQSEGTMLKNEVYSFQVAYKLDASSPHSCLPIAYGIEHNLGEAVSVRFVDYVPCDFAIYDHALPPFEHPYPGLFPDILKPVPKQIWAYKQNYRCLWISLDGTKNELTPGKYTITVSFLCGQETGSISYTINILDKTIPCQKLICTNWFHTDCICNYYNVEFDSDEYWRITENFAKTAADYGINMLLTPIFTPPLDTEAGGERRTIQLIDVYKNNGKYTFGFHKLVRWVEMCKRVGIKYYEISHLFTQWGCRYAPKIMGYNNGEYIKLFGWETDAHGNEYKDFLSCLLPELVNVLTELGISEYCYFHVSDEPGVDMLADYKDGAEFLKKHIKGFKTFDALSSIEFYRSGAVECPVPALDHLGAFLDEGIKDLWTYYCCGQTNVSNRFLAFPSQRNRQLGLQLFRHDIAGFLQWGFNFYNTYLSREPLDPYASSTGGGWVPGGDTFVVYPGLNGNVYASVRLEVFREALQDLRALQGLQENMGKEKVIDLINNNIQGEKLSYRKVDVSAKEIINIRELINKEL